MAVRDFFRRRDDYRVIVQPALRTTPPPLWLRPLMVGDALCFYLWKIVAPIHLVAVYGRMISFLTRDRWLYIEWLIPLTLAIMLWLKRRTWPTLSFAGAIFVIALSPNLGLFRFDYQYYSTVADHYVYLAMLGPAIALGFVLQRVGYRFRNASIAIVVTVLLVFAAISFRQARFWKNDDTLYTHSLSIAPNGVLALHNLGNLRMREGHVDEAIGLFQQALDLEPNHYESAGAMATLLARQGKIEDGNRWFRQFLEQEGALPDSLRPKQYTQHLLFFAGTMFNQGNREESIKYYKMLLAIDPTDSVAQRGLQRAEALPRFGL